MYIIYALQTSITPTIHLFRKDLRAILLDSITKDTIQWGRTVKSVVLSDNLNQHTLTFTDDSKETYDLVVGADGAWSVVRPLLTPNRPVYTDLSFIDATISDIDNRFPSLSVAAGPGLVLSLGHNKSIMTQRQSHGYLRIYATLRVPQSWCKSFKPTRRAVLDLYSDGWSSDLLDFLRSYDESSLVLRNIYALPVPTTWKTQPGLTLIGDAAHLISPFAGEGGHFLASFIYNSKTESDIITILRCKPSYAGRKRIGTRDYRCREGR
jgi:2-polyprenyl-6-methoxyphenol hydroxylase-like FAD-dependent oxidoreductase